MQPGFTSMFMKKVEKDHGFGLALCHQVREVLRTQQIQILDLLHNFNNLHQILISIAHLHPFYPHQGKGHHLELEYHRKLLSERYSVTFFLTAKLFLLTTDLMFSFYSLSIDHTLLLHPLFRHQHQHISVSPHQTFHHHRHHIHFSDLHRIRWLWVIIY